MIEMVNDDADCNDVEDKPARLNIRCGFAPNSQREERERREERKEKA